MVHVHRKPGCRFRRGLGGVQWAKQRFLEIERQSSFDLVLLSHDIGGIWYHISLKLAVPRGFGQMNQVILTFTGGIFRGK